MVGCGTIMRQRQPPLSSGVRLQRILVQTLVPIAICIGFVTGALAAYRLASALCRVLSAHSSGFQLIATFAFAGAVLAMLPVGFLSIVGGGSLGGAYLSSAFGTYAAPVGIALGISLTFALGVTGCASVFALAGKLVARLVYGSAAT